MRLSKVTEGVKRVDRQESLEVENFSKTYLSKRTSKKKGGCLL